MKECYNITHCRQVFSRCKSGLSSSCLAPPVWASRVAQRLRRGQDIVLTRSAALAALLVHLRLALLRARRIPGCLAAFAALLERRRSALSRACRTHSAVARSHGDGTDACRHAGPASDGPTLQRGLRARANWQSAGAAMGPFLQERRGAAASLDRAVRVEPEIEVIVDRGHQLLELVLEEVVGARDFLVMDGDVLLRA